MIRFDGDTKTFYSSGNHQGISMQPSGVTLVWIGLSWTLYVAIIGDFLMTNVIHLIFQILFCIVFEAPTHTHPKVRYFVLFPH